MEKKKVIIIGAGPAGLMAGYELVKQKDKYDITILEADNQVGGISRTVKYNSHRMDIGGHRFFSKDDRIMKIWEELMPIQGVNSFDDEILKNEKPLKQGGPNPNEQDEVMLIRRRVSRIYYLKKFFDYPVSMKKETFTNMGFVRTIKAGCSYLKSMIFKRKEKSLEDFYINRFGKVLYGMFFEKYTEKLWGRHPSEISPDWGSQRVKGLSITEVIKDMFNKVFGKKDKENTQTSLIEEFWYPKYGPGHLWETLAKKLEEQGVNIKMQHEVVNIELGEDNNISLVKCKTNNGEEKITGDYFLSSMSVKDLVEGMSQDKVPSQTKEIASGLPYRDFITVGVLVNKLNLENKTNFKTLGNIVPDCWIYVQEPEVKMGRIQVFNNWSPYLVKDPKNTVWIGLEYFCEEGDSMWDMSEDEFKKFAISELEVIKVIDADSVLDSHVEKVKKAYPAYFDTYSKIDELIDFLNKIPNLYCIGRNGQHRYNNMDHSMATAIEATYNIMNGITSKDNVWEVNTEKEYHETKKEEEDEGNI